jgi:hypothetical protein
LSFHSLIAPSNSFSRLIPVPSYPDRQHYRHLLLLLFISSPSSGRNPYTRTLSSSRLRKCIEHSSFRSTVGEPSMANRTPRIWQCHVCNTGPHTCATTPACTGVRSDNRQCGHIMCSRCKKDNDIPNPLGTAASRSFRTRATMIDANATPRTVPSMAPRGTKSGRGRGRGLYHQPALRLSSRPSMAGWWTCSVCGSMNNPELSDGRCTTCNHRKCRDCRACR